MAIIHGFALGGGLGTGAWPAAIAARVQAATSFSIGLPEVMLGIHPGFGGTVRAVRLCAGVRTAMQIDAHRQDACGPTRPKRAGFIDRLVYPADAEAAARELIKRRPAATPPGLLDRAALGWPLARGLVSKQLLAQVRAKARPEHYPAPYALIDLWSTYGVPTASGPYEAEAHSIAPLMVGDTSRNLGAGFHASGPPEEPRRQIETAAGTSHVVGAGVMSGDIAAWCAQRGLNVTLQDRELKFIEPALTRARKASRNDSRQGKSRGAHDPHDPGRGG